MHINTHSFNIIAHLHVLQKYMYFPDDLTSSLVVVPCDADLVVYNNLSELLRIMILTASIRSELQVAGHVIDESPQILHIFREDSFLNGIDSCCGNNLQVDNIQCTMAGTRLHKESSIKLNIRSYMKIVQATPTLIKLISTKVFALPATKN